jgi:hypothetical protein
MALDNGWGNSTLNEHGLKNGLINFPLRHCVQSYETHFKDEQCTFMSDGPHLVKRLLAPPELISDSLNNEDDKFIITTTGNII